MQKSSEIDHQVKTNTNLIWYLTPFSTFIKDLSYDQSEFTNLNSSYYLNDNEWSQDVWDSKHWFSLEL